MADRHTVALNKHAAEVTLDTVLLILRVPTLLVKLWLSMAP